MNKEDCIEACNDMLVGELSAVEAYNITIEKYSDQPQVSELTRIKNEHIESAIQLESHVLGLGGEPAQGSGAWGVVVKGIQHTANLFGEESALKSLQRGEEIGKKQYEVALGKDYHQLACKNLINQKLLPQVKHHIATLGRLEDQVG